MSRTVKTRWLPVLAAMLTKRPVARQIRTALRLMFGSLDLPPGRALIVDDMVIELDGGWHRQWTIRNGRETHILHTSVTESLGYIGEEIPFPPETR